jgi:hypothetical protein
MHQPCAGIEAASSRGFTEQFTQTTVNDTLPENSRKSEYLLKLGASGSHF